MTGFGPHPPRCIVCGTRDWLAKGDRARCSHCALDVDPARYDPAAWTRRLLVIDKLQQRLSSALARSRRKDYLPLRYALGAGNGLLPCGLVYLAAIGAANAGSPLNGAVFMLAFGAGTLPLLLLTLTAGRKVVRMAPATFRRLVPLLTLTVGLLLVWRGWRSGLPADYQQFQELFFPPRCH